MSRIALAALMLTVTFGLCGCTKQDPPRARSTGRTKAVNDAQRAIEYQAQHAKRQIDAVAREAEEELERTRDTRRLFDDDRTQRADLWNEIRAQIEEAAKDRAIDRPDPDEVIEEVRFDDSPGRRDRQESSITEEELIDALEEELDRS